LNEIRILQLGDRDWNFEYIIPDNIVLDHVCSFLELPEEVYHLYFLDRTPLEEETELLYRAVKAYSLFVTDKVACSGKVEWLCRSRKAQRIAAEDIQRFLLQEAGFYYTAPYGDKFELGDLGINRGFRGAVKWNGNCGVTLTGAFGDVMRQAVFWRYNRPVSRGQVLDLWLEYRKKGNVSVSLEVIQFAAGSAEKVLDHWKFDEADLEHIIQIENKHDSGNLSFSIKARGEGALQIIALHQRLSRGSHGFFLPGGERYVTSEREEIFAYFEPGDLKPPLNVYFSGYKTKQGFEGFFQMKRLGCPFLLLSEARLEGGGFYMGSGEYESLFTHVIRKYMDELGFTGEQVIFSGLSMGTYGALYYGCDFTPHALILGKPLASIGNVAVNEKYLRPAGFPTSLDVLRYHCDGMGASEVEELNKRFWDKFDGADWGRSKLIVSYMLEDDYDPDAYERLCSHLRSGGTRLYGKGIHGRHNDNTGAIVKWFISQFEQVLSEDFARRIEE